MRSFGIPNVWVGVVSLVAWIVLIDDSPKGRGKLIPFGGFRWTWIKVGFDLPKSTSSSRLRKTFLEWRCVSTAEVAVTS